MDINEILEENKRLKTKINALIDLYEKSLEQLKIQGNKDRETKGSVSKDNIDIFSFLRQIDNDGERVMCKYISKLKDYQKFKEASFSEILKSQADPDGVLNLLLALGVIRVDQHGKWKIISKKEDKSIRVVMIRKTAIEIARRVTDD